MDTLEPPAVEKPQGKKIQSTPSGEVSIFKPPVSMINAFLMFKMHPSLRTHTHRLIKGSYINVILLDGMSHILIRSKMKPIISKSVLHKYITI